MTASPPPIALKPRRAQLKEEVRHSISNTDSIQPSTTSIATNHPMHRSSTTQVCTSTVDTLHYCSNRSILSTNSQAHTSMWMARYLIE